MKTNAPFLALSILIAISPTGRAADSDVVELARLQQAYRAKIESEVKPVRDKYVEALVALEKKLAAAGKIDAAGEVRAEREIILKSEIYAPGYAPVDRDAKVETADELRDYLELSEWVLWIGAVEKGIPQPLTFHDNSNCELNGQKVKWKVTGDRAVEISSRDWTGVLTLTFDVKLKTFVGRGSGDAKVRHGRLLKR